MFALGVMVGRGTAPITFDTREFQSRLEAIAREYGARDQKAQKEQKVDLRFYDVLDQPVVLGSKGKKAGEILPAREPLAGKTTIESESLDGVPVKLGKKMVTLNAVLLAEYQDQAVPVKSVKPPAKTPVVKKKLAVKSNSYTIQLAAFQAYNDAASHIAALKKKGIAAYHVKGQKNGSSWYRVRTGAFPDYEAALSGLEKLKAAKIDGMIIKKE